MSDPTGYEVLVHPRPEDVAEALATRLTARVAELQSQHRLPQLCLTGGRIATQAYQRLAAEGGRSAVDWSRVDLWWGDERFVDAADPDRNAKQALDLLGGALPLSQERIHPMPAANAGPDLDEAAALYAAELGTTVFDICLLGMGPDGHVASVFPEHPSSHAEGSVIAVRSSPKPPPLRVSLTLATLNTSREVWFCVTGQDKAAALAMALLGTGPVQLPAAGVRGTQRTLWLVDREAAAELPRDIQPVGLI